jgi:hypothetical protein
VTNAAGLELCRDFHAEAVRPLLAESYPGLRYAAGRIGPGSDVLGFDTQRSVDHDWGPRLDLFLTLEDVARHGEAISAMLSRRLPKQFRGWPTNFEPRHARIRVMVMTDGPVAHRVMVTDVGGWCDALLGFDARAGVSTADWLATPTQRLAEVTGGAVFHDDIGELTAIRQRLAWYPEDVWRYLLACQWMRIAEEEAFVGRTAEVGDELGSRLVTGRLVRDVMRLCLLLARRYPPYGKWLGSAFTGLPAARDIAGALETALTTTDASARQAALCTAYELTGGWQNRLGIAAPVDATRRMFHNRPFPVIGADRFAHALRERIEDADVAALPPVGAIDQYVDNTALLVQPDLLRPLAATLWTGRS